MDQETLTTGNAHTVSTIVSKSNPEWGVKRFNHNEQPLLDGEFASTHGVGSNSSMLFEGEYKFWSVVSYK